MDEEVLIAAVNEDSLGMVEGLTRPRGLAVDGEGKAGRVVDVRRRLDVFFKGVGLPTTVGLRGMKGDGTAGLEWEAFGVVVTVSVRDDSEARDMSAESRLGGGAVSRRFSVDGREDCDP